MSLIASYGYGSDPNRGQGVIAIYGYGRGLSALVTRFLVRTVMVLRAHVLEVER